eukprot:3733442-Prymnesium_polylepis.1
MSGLCSWNPRCGRTRPILHPGCFLCRARARVCREQARIGSAAGREAGTPNCKPLLERCMFMDQVRRKLPAPPAFRERGARLA